MEKITKELIKTDIAIKKRAILKLEEEKLFCDKKIKKIDDWIKGLEEKLNPDKKEVQQDGNKNIRKKD